jgi:hypothetical protein
MITITKTSPITGKVNAMELNISVGHYEQSLQDWENGALIQNAFPTLSADEREFLMTGITPEEWQAAFGDDE